MKRWRRWLVGLGVAAALAVYARPAWEILVFVFDDPLSDHGTAAFLFTNERSEEVFIVALRLGEKVYLGEATSGTGSSVPSPRLRGQIPVAIMTTLAGLRQAEIRYKTGNAEDPDVLRFDVEILAQSQCRVTVTFGEDGPRASACTHHHPGTYGGTWAH